MWDTGETAKTFHQDDLPKSFVFEPKTEAEYYVCTSFDKSEVFSIGPWEGSFDAIPHDISRDKDTKQPIFYLNTFKVEGKEKTTAKFKIFWKITEPGEFKGQIAVQQQMYQGDYAGLRADDDGFVEYIGNSQSDKAVWHPRLKEFLDEFKVTKKEIQMPKDGNCLPEIWDRVEENAHTVRVKIEKGEVVGLSSTKGKRSISDEDVDDDDFVEESTPKRSVEELKAELAGETLPDPDEAFKKPAKKLAKKVVDEEEDDL